MINIQDWVVCQKQTYGDRPGLTLKLAKKRAEFILETNRLSGDIVDLLLTHEPMFLPIAHWGGKKGWLSKKRQIIWTRLLFPDNSLPNDRDFGYLIRTEIDASVCVPHPYNPPQFVLRDFELFKRYIVDSLDIFTLCKTWELENSLAVENLLKNLFLPINIKIAARYVCSQATDYVDIAISYPITKSYEHLVRVPNPWKSQELLSAILIDYFPDLVREYKPEWLGGQRIDIYIPSFSVAIEYQGEQHYFAIEYFGGHKNFMKNKQRDKIKASRCQENGIKLIYWDYQTQITERKVKELADQIRNGCV